MRVGKLIIGVIILVVGNLAWGYSINYPADSAKTMTATFGEYREYGWFHDGIDLSGSWKVYAAASGTATIYYMPNHGYGNTVLIQHSGFQTKYCHLKSGTIHDAIKNGDDINDDGDYVDAGEVAPLQVNSTYLSTDKTRYLAYSGGTGSDGENTFSDHLHFETGDTLLATPSASADFSGYRNPLNSLSQTDTTAPVIDSFILAGPGSDGTLGTADYVNITNNSQISDKIRLITEARDNSCKTNIYSLKCNVVSTDRIQPQVPKQGFSAVPIC